MQGNTSENWLELLLAGVSVDAIYSRRDELVQEAVDPAHAERQAWRFSCTRFSMSGVAGSRS